MTLSELPRGAKLKVLTKGATEKRLATFHRLDGSYSVCTLDGAQGPGPTGIFHLHRDEELIAIGTPVTHYELVGTQ